MGGFWFPKRACQGTRERYTSPEAACGTPHFERPEQRIDSAVKSPYENRALAFAESTPQPGPPSNCPIAGVSENRTGDIPSSHPRILVPGGVLGGLSYRQEVAKAPCPLILAPIGVCGLPEPGNSSVKGY